MYRESFPWRTQAGEAATTLWNVGERTKLEPGRDCLGNRSTSTYLLSSMSDATVFSNTKRAQFFGYKLENNLFIKTGSFLLPMLRIFDSSETGPTIFASSYWPRTI